MRDDIGVGRIAGVIVGIVVTASAATAQSTAGRERQEAAGGAARQVISGTVTLNGCVVTPAQLHIAAHPLEVRHLSSGRGDADDGGVLADARTPAGAPTASRRLVTHVARTRDPHVFAFTIRTVAGHLHRLAIGVADTACGKVFWRGPVDGLAVAGGEPVHIEGFAARTEVELLADPAFRDPDLASPRWVGADAIDLTTQARGTRTLRWRSTLPAVQSGELQIAVAPFPTGRRAGACAEPAEGLVLRQVVTGRRGRWTELSPIDFHALTSPRRASDEPAGDDAGATATITPALARRLRAGSPLYARVVAIAGGERQCDVRTDGVAGWAIVANLAPPAQAPVPPPTPPSMLNADGQRYDPPFVGGQFEGRPTYGERGFTVLRDHVLPPVACVGWALYYRGVDPVGCEILAAGWRPPGGTVTKGSSILLGPPPSSGGGGGGFLSFFTDTLPSLATGVIDAIGMGVNILSGLVEDVKGALADAVLSVLEALPLVKSACEGLGSTGLSDCETLVKGAMEAGMVAMGLPPSLPDWEALKDQGVDYLAAQIAEQAGGGPLAQTLTEAAIKELAQETLDAITEQKSGKGGPYGWLQPYLFFDPAVWTTTVGWNGTGTLPSSLVLRRYASSLYLGADLPLPTTTLPSLATLRVPMVLQPRLTGIPAPVCSVNRFAQVSCVPGFASSQPHCFGEQWVSTGNGWGTGSWTWLEFDCQRADYVAIYYRDRWVSGRHDATPCVNLAASTFQEVNGLLLASPQPPFVTLGRVETTVPRFWVGNVLLSPGCP